MPERPTADELLTAEQAQRRLGVGRSLFWKLVKYHGVPQFVEPVSGQEGTMRDASRVGRCRWQVGQDGRPCGKPAVETVELPVHWAAWSVVQPVPLCAEHRAAAQGRPAVSG